MYLEKSENYEALYNFLHPPLYLKKNKLSLGGRKGVVFYLKEL
jgi:hypothetical protein